jgi:hypothetical protein
MQEADVRADQNIQDNCGQYKTEALPRQALKPMMPAGKAELFLKRAQDLPDLVRAPYDYVR